VGSSTIFCENAIFFAERVSILKRRSERSTVLYGIVTDSHHLLHWSCQLQHKLDVKGKVIIL